MLQYVWVCRNILQHPEQQRRRGPGSPPADAPARPCGFPRMPLGMRARREGASGVRGCPGKLHRSGAGTAERSEAVPVTRDASLAIRPDYPLSTPSPSGNRRPPGIDDRRHRRAGNVASAAISVINDASAAIAEAGNSKHPHLRATIAPRSARARPPHVRCGAGGATPRPRRIPAPIARRGARRRGSRPPLVGGRRGRPRAPERRCYRFGTTASK